MRKKYLHLVILCMLTLLNVALNAQPNLARIAVLPFIIDDKYRIEYDGETIKHEIVESELSSQLIEFLVKSRKFNVVQREKLDKIINENDLTDSDWAKEGEAQRIGQLLVADFIVVGYIDRLEFKVRKKHIALTGENKVEFTVNMKIHFQVTAVKSGKIVCADHIKKILTDREIRDKFTHEQLKDMTFGDFKDILFNKLVKEAGTKILEGVYPIKIASVNGQDVILNRGAGAGVEVGDILSIYKQGEGVKDPDTGEILGTQEKLIATIKVTETHPKFSQGIVVQATEPIAVGSICRPAKKREKNDEEPPQIPKATQGW